MSLTLCSEVKNVNDVPDFRFMRTTIEFNFFFQLATVVQLFKNWPILLTQMTTSIIKKLISGEEPLQMASSQVNA
jgi:hypothetical protein